MAQKEINNERTQSKPSKLAQFRLDFEYNESWSETRKKYKK